MKGEWPHDVTWVVLSYSDGPAPDVVERLRDDDVPPENIVVVHNPGPRAETARVSPGSAGQVVNRPTNDGYGPAMNDGIHVARSHGASYAILCTHDAVISGEAAQHLVRTLRDFPDVAAAGPVLSDGRVEFSAGGRLLLGRASHLERNGTHTREVDWLDGSVLAVRLDLPHRFPDDYFLYWEDVAFARTARESGYSVVCVQAATAVSIPGNAGSRAALYSYLRWRNALLDARRRSTLLEPVAITVLLLADCLRSLVTRSAGAQHLSNKLRAVRDGWLGHAGKPAQSLLQGSDAS